MRHFRLQSAALAAALALSACNLNVPASTLSQGKQPAQPDAGASQNAVASAKIVGSVMAPAGVIAAGGGNVIAAGGDNVIAPGGGNAIAVSGGNFAGDRHVMALGENPLANAEVFLANAAGTPYPIDPVKTDDKGNFTLPAVPAGFTFMVAAKVKTKDGKDATLQTLVKSTALGATAKVDASTTLVTTAVVAGRGDALGNFNEVTFKNAVEATSSQLTADTLPDLADKTAMLAAMTRLETDVAAIKLSLDELKKDLAEIKTSLDDLNAKIDQLSKQKQPQPMMPPPPMSGHAAPPMPGAMMPPPPGAPTTQPVIVEHSFFLDNPPTDTRLYPIAVEIRVANQAQVVASLKFATPTSRVVGKLPADQLHDLYVQAANETAMRLGLANVIFSQGLPYELPLPPIPFTGSGTTTTTPYAVSL